MCYGELFTFNVSEGDWHLSSNWDGPEGRIPGLGDIAIIPSLSRCHIVQFEIIDLLYIESSGCLSIEDGGALTLADDVMMSGGRLVIQNNAQLFIWNDILIWGDGGRIQLAGGTINPVEESNIHQLTINWMKTIVSPISLGGYGTINVAFHNKGLVFAATPGKALVLDKYDKIATHDPYNPGGLWSANNGGILNVKTKVSGSGQWQIVGIHPEDEGCAIIICSPCLYLSGDVRLFNGLFIVEQPFHSTGYLHLKSYQVLSLGYRSVARIVVTKGAVASFGHQPEYPVKLKPVKLKPVKLKPVKLKRE